MDKAQALYLTIEAVVFVLPIACLIWKAGKQAQKIEDHEKRIIELEKNNSELNEVKVDIAEIKTAIMYIKERIA